MLGLERHSLMICYHHGSDGGGANGTEEAAHQADHRKIAKVWCGRLKSMTETEKRNAIPQIRYDISSLAATASATQGNPTEHISVSVSMVNRWLPGNLKIAEAQIER